MTANSPTRRSLSLSSVQPPRRFSAAASAWGHGAWLAPAPWQPSRTSPCWRACTSDRRRYTRLCGTWLPPLHGWLPQVELHSRRRPKRHGVLSPAQLQVCLWSSLLLDASIGEMSWSGGRGTAHLSDPQHMCLPSAGALSKTATAPLEKLRMQLMTNGKVCLVNVVVGTVSSISMFKSRSRCRSDYGFALLHCSQGRWISLPRPGVKVA